MGKKTRTNKINTQAAEKLRLIKIELIAAQAPFPGVNW